MFSRSLPMQPPCWLWLRALAFGFASLVFLVGAIPDSGMRMYCGSKRFKDPSGKEWLPQKFVSFATFHKSLRAVVKSNGLSPVYRSTCEGSFIALRFPNATAGVTYMVTLYGTDPSYKEPGRRLFNVLCGGTTVAQNVDIAREAGGRLLTWKRTFRCKANQDGVVSMDIIATRYQATIGGAEVVREDATATAVVAEQPDELRPVPQEVIWRDDFTPCTGDGCVNGGIRTSDWGFQIGDGGDIELRGWGNWQLDCAQNGSDVASIVPNPYVPGDGFLRISAIRSDGPFLCQNLEATPETKFWSSARLRTAGKRSFVYEGNASRYRPLFVEARLNWPDAGQGFWPSIRLSPEASEYGVWPSSGDIGIASTYNDMKRVQAGLVYKSMYGGAEKEEVTWGSEDHLFLNYGVEWTPHYMRFFIDGQTVAIMRPEAWYSGYRLPNLNAPFDKEFFLSIMFAVGGNVPGDVNASTPNVGFMDIDWVQVSLGPWTDSPPDPQPPPSPRQPSATSAPLCAVHFGKNNFTDSKGINWLTAQDNQPYGIQLSGVLRFSESDNRIFNAADRQEMYRSCVVGDKLRITMSVPNGAYLVTFHSAEAWWDSPGSRVFSVSCNGVPGLSDVDFVGEVGPFQPYVRSFYCTVDNGVMALQFKTLTDYAQVSGLMLQPVARAAVPAVVPQTIYGTRPLLGDDIEVIWHEAFLPCRPNEAGCTHGGLRDASWSFSVGNGMDYGLGGWGNWEQQCYQNTTAVLYVEKDPDEDDDGILRVMASKIAPFTCENRAGPTAIESFTWRSARIKTMGKRSFMWAGTPELYRTLRIEVKLFLPGSGKGFWPGVWLMPDSPKGMGCEDHQGKDPDCFGHYGVWPNSGEIDMMESINDMANIYSTMHLMTTEGWRFYGSGGVPVWPQNQWHTVWMEWSPHAMVFGTDDNITVTLTYEPWMGFYWDKSPNYMAPFDKPFYLIINLAVGGQMPGFPDDTTPDTGTMQIDYVRVTHLPWMTGRKQA